MRENLEFKARCGDFTELDRKVMALGAHVEGSYREVDTYFQVPVGRRNCGGGRAGPGES